MTTKPADVAGTGAGGPKGSPHGLERLEADGFIHRGADGVHTTKRWQGAMSRAALRLYQGGAPWRDLRLPIVSALLEFYGDLPDDEILSLVEVILPIETRELDQAFGGCPFDR